ncbi:GNAT family N-acetyltransferase [Bacillus sp. ISL-47]|uniref:GNAT family N-acetyltransferase n=1 Tax=Bacillus sp. ISL-47 TaxID=2819130 RepID=UPI001BE4E8B6|nr:GNAT family N-acetyltransferase [Bacillus sp. ISL-47]MBT2690993.1 GNAT family N-acetyltransferase [Bacillus sp. ISL-47]MBT2710413.1 GNAT family N-acetyltransferase [Pseudomonas sp. ISL-84]
MAVIRRAMLKDARVIAEVHVKSWKETYKGILDQNFLENLKVESREKLWLESLGTKRENEFVFAAETEEGKIVGFASVGPERSKRFDADGELYAIYLLENYQGNQIGTKLFLSGVKELSKAGFRSVLVWVLADNKSRQFYENFHPEKADEEEITIAGTRCVEVAYVWSDIKGLINSLEKSIQ